MIVSSGTINPVFRPSSTDEGHRGQPDAIPFRRLHNTAERAGVARPYVCFLFVATLPFVSVSMACAADRDCDLLLKAINNRSFLEYAYHRLSRGPIDNQDDVLKELAGVFENESKSSTNRRCQHRCSFYAAVFHLLTSKEDGDKVSKKTVQGVAQALRSDETAPSVNRVIPQRVCAFGVLCAVSPEERPLGKTFTEATKFCVLQDLSQSFAADECFMRVFVERFEIVQQAIQNRTVEDATEDVEGYKVTYSHVSGDPQQTCVELYYARVNSFYVLARIRANIDQLRPIKASALPKNSYFEPDDLDVNRNKAIEEWEIKRLWRRYNSDPPFGPHEFYQNDAAPKFGTWERYHE